MGRIVFKMLNGELTLILILIFLTVGDRIDIFYIILQIHNLFNSHRIDGIPIIFSFIQKCLCFQCLFEDLKFLFVLKLFHQLFYTNFVLFYDLLNPFIALLWMQRLYLILIKTFHNFFFSLGLL